MQNIASPPLVKGKIFSFLQLIAQAVLFSVLLFSNFAYSATTLSASTPTSNGDFTLSWTATSTWYGANIYENNIKIGGATMPTYSLSRKANGSYDYYVETCYQSCTLHPVSSMGCHPRY